MNAQLKIAGLVGVLAAGCAEESSSGAGTDGTGAAGSSTSGASTPSPTPGADADADAGATDGGSTTGTSVDTGTDPGTETGAGSSSDGGSEDTNCCTPHGTPECNEPDVIACVCAVQASCCVFDWDGVCADLAQNDCEAECISDTGSGSDGTGDACDRLVVLEVPVEDAQLDGGWNLMMSMQGEGMIAVMTGGRGDITYSVDAPCDDTWHVWVRWYEDGGAQNSFFAAVDGAPDPAAIFEHSCPTAGFGQGWTWSEMTWRDPDAPTCQYVEDPWTFDWSAGPHELVYGFREAVAMARITLTNDPNFTPR